MLNVARDTKTKPRSKGDLSIAVTDKQKTEILRDIWIAHDGRWFIKTAAAKGFDVATELNLAVQESFGKTEMRQLLKAFGGLAVNNMKDLHRFLEAASDIYCPVEHEYEYTVIDEGTLSLKILQCYVHNNVSKAGNTQIHTCAGRTRFEAWLKGLGLDGVIIGGGKIAACKGSCEFIFTIHW